MTLSLGNSRQAHTQWKSKTHKCGQHIGNALCDLYNKIPIQDNIDNHIILEHGHARMKEIPKGIRVWSWCESNKISAVNNFTLETAQWQEYWTNNRAIENILRDVATSSTDNAIMKSLLGGTSKPEIQNQWWVPVDPQSKLDSIVTVYKPIKMQWEWVIPRTCRNEITISQGLAAEVYNIYVGPVYPHTMYKKNSCLEGCIGIMVTKKDTAVPVIKIVLAPVKAALVFVDYKVPSRIKLQHSNLYNDDGNEVWEKLEQNKRAELEKIIIDASKIDEPKLLAQERRWIIESGYNKERGGMLYQAKSICQEFLQHALFKQLELQSVKILVHCVITGYILRSFNDTQDINGGKTRLNELLQELKLDLPTDKILHSLETISNLFLKKVWISQKNETIFPLSLDTLQYLSYYDMCKQLKQYKQLLIQLWDKSVGKGDAETSTEEYINKQLEELQNHLKGFTNSQSNSGQDFIRKIKQSKAENNSTKTFSYLLQQEKFNPVLYTNLIIPFNNHTHSFDLNMQSIPIFFKVRRWWDLDTEGGIITLSGNRSIPVQLQFIGGTNLPLVEYDQYDTIEWDLDFRALQERQVLNSLFGKPSMNNNQQQQIKTVVGNNASPSIVNLNRITQDTEDAYYQLLPIFQEQRLDLLRKSVFNVYVDWTMVKNMRTYMLSLLNNINAPSLKQDGTKKIVKTKGHTRCIQEDSSHAWILGYSSHDRRIWWEDELRIPDTSTLAYWGGYTMIQRNDIPDFPRLQSAVTEDNAIYSNRYIRKCGIMNKSYWIWDNVGEWQPLIAASNTVYPPLALNLPIYIRFERRRPSQIYSKCLFVNDVVQKTDNWNIWEDNNGKIDFTKTALYLYDISPLSHDYKQTLQDIDHFYNNFQCLDETSRNALQTQNLPNKLAFLQKFMLFKLLDDMDSEPSTQKYVKQFKVEFQLWISMMDRLAAKQNLPSAQPEIDQMFTTFTFDHMSSQDNAKTTILSKQSQPLIMQEAQVDQQYQQMFANALEEFNNATHGTGNVYTGNIQMFSSFLDDKITEEILYTYGEIILGIVHKQSNPTKIITKLQQMPTLQTLQKHGCVYKYVVKSANGVYKLKDATEAVLGDNDDLIEWYTWDGVLETKHQNNETLPGMVWYHKQVWIKDVNNNKYHIIDSEKYSANIQDDSENDTQFQQLSENGQKITKPNTGEQHARNRYKEGNEQKLLKINNKWVWQNIPPPTIQSDVITSCYVWCNNELKQYNTEPHNPNSISPPKVFWVNGQLHTSKRIGNQWTSELDVSGLDLESITRFEIDNDFFPVPSQSNQMWKVVCNQDPTGQTNLDQYYLQAIPKMLTDNDGYITKYWDNGTEYNISKDLNTWRPLPWAIISGGIFYTKTNTNTKPPTYSIDTPFGPVVYTNVIDTISQTSNNTSKTGRKDPIKFVSAGDSASDSLYKLPPGVATQDVWIGYDTQRGLTQIPATGYPWFIWYLDSESNATKIIRAPVIQTNSSGHVKYYSVFNQGQWIYNQYNTSEYNKLPRSFRYNGVTYTKHKEGSLTYFLSSSRSLYTAEKDWNKFVDNGSYGASKPESSNPTIPDIVAELKDVTEIYDGPTKKTNPHWIWVDAMKAQDVRTNSEFLLKQQPAFITDIYGTVKYFSQKDTNNKWIYESINDKVNVLPWQFLWMDKIYSLMGDGHEGQKYETSDRRTYVQETINWDTEGIPFEIPEQYQQYTIRETFPEHTGPITILSHWIWTSFTGYIDWSQSNELKIQPVFVTSDTGELQYFSTVSSGRWVYCRITQNSKQHLPMHFAYNGQAFTREDIGDAIYYRNIENPIDTYIFEVSQFDWMGQEMPHDVFNKVAAELAQRQGQANSTAVFMDYELYAGEPVVEELQLPGAGGPMRSTKRRRPTPSGPYGQ